MKEIAIQDLHLNPFAIFGKDWMALTAGNEQNGYNTMTIAWGHLGSIWERGNHRNCLPTAICPDRDFHTMYVGEIVKVLVNEKAE